MNIKCKLRLHKWKYNSEKIRHSTSRVCIKCNKKQKYERVSIGPVLDLYSYETDKWIEKK